MRSHDREDFVTLLHSRACSATLRAMAAPPLDVDWEAVKAHAITHGVRESARAYGISENTVMQRSRRERWLADVGKTIQEAPKSMQPIVRNVRTPAQAARYSVDTLKSRSKFRMMKALDKGALHASRQKGDYVFANAQQLNQLASAHAKLCPPEQSAGTPMLSLTFLSQPVEHVVTGHTTDVAS